MALTTRIARASFFRQPKSKTCGKAAGRGVSRNSPTSSPPEMPRGRRFCTCLPHRATRDLSGESSPRRTRNFRRFPAEKAWLPSCWHTIWRPKPRQPPQVVREMERLVFEHADLPVAPKRIRRFMRAQHRMTEERDFQNTTSFIHAWIEIAFSMAALWQREGRLNGYSRRPPPHSISSTTFSSNG